MVFYLLFRLLSLLALMLDDCFNFSPFQPNPSL